MIKIPFVKMWAWMIIFSILTPSFSFAIEIQLGERERFPFEIVNYVNSDGVREEEPRKAFSQRIDGDDYVMRALKRDGTCCEEIRIKRNRASTGYVRTNETLRGSGYTIIDEATFLARTQNRPLNNDGGGDLVRVQTRDGREYTYSRGNGNYRNVRRGTLFPEQYYEFTDTDGAQRSIPSSNIRSVRAENGSIELTTDGSTPTSVQRRRGPVEGTLGQGQANIPRAESIPLSEVSLPSEVEADLNELANTPRNLGDYLNGAPSGLRDQFLTNIYSEFLNAGYLSSDDGTVISRTDLENLIRPCVPGTKVKHGDTELETWWGSDVDTGRSWYSFKTPSEEGLITIKIFCDNLESQVLEIDPFTIPVDQSCNPENNDLLNSQNVTAVDEARRAAALSCAQSPPPSCSFGDIACQVGKSLAQGFYTPVSMTLTQGARTTDWVRSFFSDDTTLVERQLDQLTKSAQDFSNIGPCGSPLGPTCLSNFTNGFAESIGGAVRGLASMAWEAVKLIGRVDVYLVSGAFDIFSAIASKITGQNLQTSVSDKVEIISQDTKNTMSGFYNGITGDNALGYIGSGMERIANGIWEAAKSEFACKEHTYNAQTGEYTCKSFDGEMGSLLCATCDQKINLMCGMSGFLTPEVIMLLFTGGGANAVKEGANASRFSRLVGSLFPRAAATAEATAEFTLTQRAARLAGRGTGHVINVARRVGRGIYNLPGAARRRIADGLTSLYASTRSVFASRVQTILRAEEAANVARARLAAAHARLATANGAEIAVAQAEAASAITEIQAQTRAALAARAGLSDAARLGRTSVTVEITSAANGSVAQTVTGLVEDVAVLPNGNIRIVIRPPAPVTDLITIERSAAEIQPILQSARPATPQEIANAARGATAPPPPRPPSTTSPSPEVPSPRGPAPTRTVSSRDIEFSRLQATRQVRELELELGRVAAGSPGSEFARFERALKGGVEDYLTKAGGFENAEDMANTWMRFETPTNEIIEGERRIDTVIGKVNDVVVTTRNTRNGPRAQVALKIVKPNGEIVERILMGGPESARLIHPESIRRATALEAQIADIAAAVPRRAPGDVSAPPRPRREKNIGPTEPTPAPRPTESAPRPTEVLPAQIVQVDEKLAEVKRVLEVILVDSSHTSALQKIERQLRKLTDLKKLLASNPSAYSEARLLQINKMEHWLNGMKNVRYSEGGMLRGGNLVFPKTGGTYTFPFNGENVTAEIVKIERSGGNLVVTEVRRTAAGPVQRVLSTDETIALLVDGTPVESAAVRGTPPPPSRRPRTIGPEEPSAPVSTDTQALNTVITPQHVARLDGRLNRIANKLSSASPSVRQIDDALHELSMIKRELEAHPNAYPEPQVRRVESLREQATTLRERRRVIPATVEEAQASVDRAFRELQRLEREAHNTPGDRVHGSSHANAIAKFDEQRQVLQNTLRDFLSKKLGAANGDALPTAPLRIVEIASDGSKRVVIGTLEADAVESLTYGDSLGARLNFRTKDGVREAFLVGNNGRRSRIELSSLRLATPEEIAADAATPGRWRIEP